MGEDVPRRESQGDPVGGSVNFFPEAGLHPTTNKFLGPLEKQESWLSALIRALSRQHLETPSFIWFGPGTSARPPGGGLRLD